ncbi:hypothetical protein DFH11DRAFT_1564543 [Phellopilus nigrolimitatus]|nr:hypothetical protein DFH11DRAFT_1564543 [Phellopilus nigrolimitatus]
MNSSSSHKWLLARLVLAVHIFVAIFLVASAQLPSFDASARVVLDSAWPASLLRWDAFHFVHVARDGYVYEHEYAFFPGTPLIMRYGAKLLHFVGLGSEGSLSSLLVAGALASAAVAVDAAFTLYDLTLHHFRSPATALLVSLLSLLSSSPPTLRYAPYAEPFFAYLSYKGMLFCARKQFFSASIAFALASMFRSNGTILIGYIPVFLSSVPETPKVVFQRKARSLLYCSFLSSIPFIPFLWHQYNAYSAFCAVPLIERRPWCSNRPPMIYSFVQSEYWDVGLFRYWTLQQLPNFLLAAPVLVLLFHASIRHVRLSFLPRIRIRLQELSIVSPNNDVKTSGEPCNSFPSDPFLALSLTPHAIHALILSTMLLISAHTQIVIRLASALPFTYWAAARLFLPITRSIHPSALDPIPESDSRSSSTEAPGKGMKTGTTESAVQGQGLGRAAHWWLGYSVLWGAVALVSWAVFLPPA